MMDKLLITGAHGFFGKYLVRACEQDYEVLAPTHAEMDLLDKQVVTNYLKNTSPRYIIHAAGYNGGIRFNADYPADIFYKNTQMGLNLFSSAMDAKVEKIVSIVASCAYPFEDQFGNLMEIMEENTFLNGKPHPSVACHGYAKRNLQLLSQFYFDEYTLNAVTACVTTLYGPGDSLDLSRTKVMMALIKKICDAKNDGVKTLTMWGSGAAHRQFIYVEDAAKYVKSMINCYNDNTKPLNICTSEDISIKNLVGVICNVVGYDGDIEWDTSKSDGQLRKQLDNTKMLNILPDYGHTSLIDGIQRTAEWYNESRNSN